MTGHAQQESEQRTPRGGAPPRGPRTVRWVSRVAAETASMWLVLDSGNDEEPSTWLVRALVIVLRLVARKAGRHSRDR